MGQKKEVAFYNRSLERALQILNAFDSEQALTLAQLASTLGLPRATVIRLCSTLAKYNFLKQDPETKRYTLGIRLFELGSIVFNALSLRRVAASHIGDLQERLGQTVFLGVLDDDDLLYLDKREDPRNPISFTSEIGRRRPPTWGMVGPTIMAFLPDDEIERICGKYPFQPTAKRSFGSSEEYIAWLRRIRTEGVAFDEERTMDGISGVAAPIRDATGKVIAAIGVAFISSSVDSKDIKGMMKEAVATADNISRDLGYPGRRGQSLRSQTARSRA